MLVGFLHSLACATSEGAECLWIPGDQRIHIGQDARLGNITTAAEGAKRLHVAIDEWNVGINTSGPLRGPERRVG